MQKGSPFNVPFCRDYHFYTFIFEIEQKQKGCQMNERYYTDLDACALLDISLSRLRARISEGKPLPPRIEVPNSRTRLWLKKDFHDWLENHTVTTKTEKPSIRRTKK